MCMNVKGGRQSARVHLCNERDMAGGLKEPQQQQYPRRRQQLTSILAMLSSLFSHSKLWRWLVLMQFRAVLAGQPKFREARHALLPSQGDRLSTNSCQGPDTLSFLCSQRINSIDTSAKWWSMLLALRCTERARTSSSGATF